MSNTTQDVDSATVKVIQNYLGSAANEMQRTLIRTAYSTIIYEIVDFGISIYDKNLELIADSPGLPMFLGANDFAIKNCVEYVGEDNFDEGDVIMMNYPYRSGAHTNDACLVKPIFFEGELVSYALVRAHWTDIGGKDPAYILDSTDVHQEGLIFPGTKLYKKGEPDEELLEILRYNSRAPDTIIGDLNAQLAALNTGEARLLELFEKYGTRTIYNAINRFLEHGEDKVRSALSEFPDGSWQAENYFDDDGISDEKVKVSVEVSISGDEFKVDFSDSDDDVEGPIYLTLGTTQSICKICLKALTTPTDPPNGGHYKPLNVVAPEGGIFNAQYPQPTYMKRGGIFAIEAIFGALAKGMPDRFPASSGGETQNPHFFGVDQVSGEMVVDSTMPGVGWGATKDFDGPSALTHIATTTIKNLPVEVLENKSPVLVQKAELRQDSGGPGRNRGGLGSRRDYMFTEDYHSLVYSKKTKTDQWGLEGGLSGAKNEIVLFSDNMDALRERITIFVDHGPIESEKPGKEARKVGMLRGQFSEGEILSNRAGGGGGWGNPFEREPEKVREDVLDGYVSKEQAEKDYGVVFTDDLDIDESATKTLRESEAD